ncbi:MAG: signal recognition particle-docking protein FtsY [Thermoprotei archaeon]|nr:MAG: signal recognition particle-docking protein FtsY [Thermoprotei archaeon]
MLEGLRRSLRGIVELLSTSALSEEELEEMEYEIVMKLVECDVALEAAEAVAKFVRDLARGRRFPRFGDKREAARSLLKEALMRVFEKAKWFDLEEEVAKACGASKPVVILFVGPNGHGKTTTIAKIGYRLIKRGFTVVLAAADTWRAGALEQLREHAEAIGAEVVGHGYGADPAAVAYDAVAYAKRRRRDVVLIDTAGRLQTDVNLMEEVRKIARVVRPHYRIFVGDALTGNDALDQAKKFDEYVGVDGAVLTKVDADAKGGAALSFVYATGKPVLYIGVGQGYEDLVPFSVEWFLERVLS